MEILYLIPFICFLFIVPRLLRKSIKKTTPKLQTLFYKQIYSDTKKNIYFIKSEKYNLRGKPDFIYKHFFLNSYIPVELKSGKLRNTSEPRFGDLMQLICYFVMIEEFYSCKVPYGKLIYGDCMFIVNNNKRFKTALTKILKDMDSFNVKNCDGLLNKKTCNTCQYKNTVCDYYKSNAKTLQS